MTGAWVDRLEAASSRLRLDDVQAWVFDVDGCLVRTDLPGGEGGTAIDGAAALVAKVKGAGHRVVCCTNGAIRPPAAYAAGLRQVGIDISETEMVTPASAGAHAIARRHPGAPVLVLGGPGMVEPLRSAGLPLVEAQREPARVVVVGPKPSYTAPEIDAACQAVSAGAPFYVTVRTPWFYGGGKRTASATSLIGVGISWLTGAIPELLGKPSQIMNEFLLAHLETDPGRLVVVGDSLDAEVRMAADLGAQSVLVRSGAPTHDQVQGAGSPTVIVDHVGELLRILDSKLP